MPLRLYFSPIIGDGLTPDTAFRTKFTGNCAAAIPSKADGTPQFNYAVAVVRATDWTATDADATLERLFGIDLPDTVETSADLKAFLQSKTVADIPAARRATLNTRLTNLGLDTSQVTPATTWWQVLRDIYNQMGVPPGNDGPQV